jgi:hypothetical protein
VDFSLRGVGQRALQYNRTGPHCPPAQPEQPQTEPRYTDREQTETATARPHSSSTSRPRPDLPQIPPFQKQSLQTSPRQTAMAAFTKLEDSPMFRKQVHPRPLSLLARRPPSGFPPVYHFGFPTSVGPARSRSGSAFRLGVCGMFTSSAWMFLSYIWSSDDPR